MTRDIPRKKALDILINTEKGKGFPDQLIDRLLDGLSTLDRAFAMELVYGVLRWRIKIDWIIDHFSKMKTGRMERLILNVLRLGVYQLLFLTKVPPHAAIDESVKLVRQAGKKKGFVNALLRRVDEDRMAIIFPNIKKEPLNYISIVHSHPLWLIERWVERYGVKQTLALCQANNLPAHVVLRCNTLLSAVDKVITRLNTQGVNVRKTSFSPLGVEIVEGSPDHFLAVPDCYVQGEASQLIPYLLSPMHGEVILDACSAPGGKTTQMAQLMNNDGVIHAMDISRRRIGLVKEASKRLNIDIITTIQGDALDEISFAPTGGFDAILLDAPCSGMGILRRDPEIKYRRNVDDIIRLSSQQLQMLENVSRYIKKGGRLVYSTCTIEPEENEGVVDRFLANHSDFTLDDAGDFLPTSCESLVDDTGYLKTMPSRDGIDGFFGARLKRLF